MESLVDQCIHCGLPAPSRQKFCCYGCELAHGLSREADDDGSTMRARVAICMFFAMNLMALSLFLYSEDVYAPPSEPGMAGLREFFRYASAVAATPVVLILGLPLARRALSLLRDATLGTELLVSLGALSAYSYSIVALATPGARVYFDVACMTLIFVAAGRWLEASSRSSAAYSLAARLALTPESVERRAGEGGWESVPPAGIVVGDVLRIPAGRSVPVDGQVEKGAARVDNSIVTGESRPVAVGLNDSVIAGSVPVDSPLEIRATSDLRNSTVARLEDLVRKARSDRAPIQGIADKCASALFPVMLSVALGTFLYWYASGEGEKGLLSAVAVLVVACPCSFGIATPLAIWAALGRAASRGVLIRGGSIVQRLARIDSVAIDKTGTLTDHAREVVELQADGDRSDVLGRMAALEGAVEHPLGASIVAFARKSDIVVPEPDRVEVLPGLGVRGAFDGEVLEIGGVALASRLGVELDESQRQPGTVVAMAGGRVVATVKTREALRPEAREAVGGLKSLASHVEILSGDTSQAAKPVARDLNLQVRAGQTPSDKFQRIEALESDGGPTMMIGDGVNDSAAMGRASLGVSLGCGSDLARAVSHVSLVSDDLSLVPWTMRLARKTMRVVRQNLAWALGYNSVCVVLAACGLITPVFAALAMLGSSATVLFNSLRIARFPEPLVSEVGQ